MKNKECISYGLKRDTGVDVSYCYQCGKCTAGCVLADEMEFPPSFLLRLLQLGDKDSDRRVLASDSIWLCLSCGNCEARCPKEIDLPTVMDYLREKSRRQGLVSRKARPIVAFHDSFLQCVKSTGKLYEIGLVAGFKMRTFRLWQDVNLVPGMLSRGKLNILPGKVGDTKTIKSIFHKTIEKDK